MIEALSGKKWKRSSKGLEEEPPPVQLLSPASIEVEAKASLLQKSMDGIKRRAKEASSLEPIAQVSKPPGGRRSWEEGTTGERRAPPKTAEAGGADNKEDGSSIQGSEDGLASTKQLEELVGLESPLPGHSRMPSALLPMPPTHNGGLLAPMMVPQQRQQQQQQQQQGVGAGSADQESRMLSNFVSKAQEQEGSQHVPSTNHLQAPPADGEAAVEAAAQAHAALSTGQMHARASSGGGSCFSEDDGISHTRVPSNYLPLPPSSDVLIGALAACDPRRSRNRALKAEPPWAQPAPMRQQLHVAVGTDAGMGTEEEGVQASLPNEGGSINSADELGTSARSGGSATLQPQWSPSTTAAAAAGEAAGAPAAHGHVGSADTNPQGHPPEGRSMRPSSPGLAPLPPLQPGGCSEMLRLDSVEGGEGAECARQPGGQARVSKEEQAIRTSGPAPTPHFRHSVQGLDPARVSYTELHAPRSPATKKANGECGSVLMGSPMSTEAKVQSQLRADLPLMGQPPSAGAASPAPQPQPAPSLSPKLPATAAPAAGAKLAPPTFGQSTDLVSRPARPAGAAQRLKPAPLPPPQPAVEGPTEAQIAAAKFRAAMQAAASKSRAAAAAAAAKQKKTAHQPPAPAPPPPTPPPATVVTKMDVLARLRRANEALNASRHKGTGAGRHLGGDAHAPAPPAAHMHAALASLQPHEPDQPVVQFGGDEEVEPGKGTHTSLRKALAAPGSSGASEGYSSGGDDDRPGEEEGSGGDGEGGAAVFRTTSPLFDLPRLLSRKDSQTNAKLLRRLSMAGSMSGRGRQAPGPSRYSATGGGSQQQTATDDLSAILQKSSTAQPQAPPAEGAQQKFQVSPATRLQQLYAAQAKAKLLAAQQARASTAVGAPGHDNHPHHRPGSRGRPAALVTSVGGGGREPQHRGRASGAWHSASAYPQLQGSAAPARSTSPFAEPSLQASPSEVHHPHRQAHLSHRQQRQQRPEGGHHAARPMRDRSPKASEAGPPHSGPVVDLALLGAGVVVPQTVKSNAMHDYLHRMMQQQEQRRQEQRLEQQREQERLEAQQRVHAGAPASTGDGHKELATAIQARKRAEAHAACVAHGSDPLGQREPWTGASSSAPMPTPPPRTVLSVFSVPRSLSHTSSTRSTTGRHPRAASMGGEGMHDDVALSDIMASMFRRTHSLTRSTSVTAHVRPPMRDVIGISPDEVLKSLLRRGDRQPRAVPPKPHSSTWGLPPHLAGYQGTSCSASYHRQASSGGKQGGAAEEIPRYAAPTLNWVAKLGQEQEHPAPPHQQPPPWAPPGPNTRHHQQQQQHEALASMGSVSRRQTQTPGEEGATTAGSCTAPPGGRAKVPRHNIQNLVRDILASKDAAAAGLTADLLAQLGLLHPSSPRSAAAAAADGRHPSASSAASPQEPQPPPPSSRPHLPAQQPHPHLQLRPHASARSAGDHLQRRLSLSSEEEGTPHQTSTPHSGSALRSHTSAGCKAGGGNAAGTSAGTHPASHSGYSELVGLLPSKHSSFTHPTPAARGSEGGPLGPSSPSSVRVGSPCSVAGGGHTPVSPSALQQPPQHLQRTSASSTASSTYVGRSASASAMGASSSMPARQPLSHHHRSASEATAVAQPAGTAGTRAFNKAFSTSSAGVLEGRDAGNEDLCSNRERSLSGVPLEREEEEGASGDGFGSPSQIPQEEWGTQEDMAELVVPTDSPLLHTPAGAQGLAMAH